jgi:hypothetical protein|eukprot:COSAG06_NODE_685_length_13103_cov_126.328668_17_plen_62_part_00
MAGLINFHGTLYFSNPATTTGRNHMTLKKSLDSGATWEVPAPANIIYGSVKTAETSAIRVS